MSEEAKGQTKEPSPRHVLGPSFRVHVGDKIALNLSPEASKLLNQLMNMTADSPDDMFRKALALYKAAMDAHKEGKAVGVAASADALETEFVGF
jgi:hypothetical protein